MDENNKQNKPTEEKKGGKSSGRQFQRYPAAWAERYDHRAEKFNKNSSGIFLSHRTILSSLPSHDSPHLTHMLFVYHTKKDPVIFRHYL